LLTVCPVKAGSNKKIWANGKKFEQMKMMNAGWFYGLLLVGKMADQSVGRWCRVVTILLSIYITKYGPTGCAILINPSLYS
jgi:hypothetical protein